jgi:FkbM family methyltransferase
MSSIKFLNSKFNLDLKDEVDRSVANEIFKFREYRVVEPIIKLAERHIFDVGAHIGLFSLYVRAFNKTVPIIAFEPEPGNFKRLARTMTENNVESIQLEPKALAYQTKKRQLIISVDSHNHKLSNSSMSEIDEKAILVEAVSLKDYCLKNNIKKIALIKIDIEGGEFELLRSWGQDDFDKIDALILEYHNTPMASHKELLDILRKSKFGVQIFPSQFDRKLGFIFAQKKT